MGAKSSFNNHNKGILKTESSIFFQKSGSPAPSSSEALCGHGPDRHEYLYIGLNSNSLLPHFMLKLCQDMLSDFSN